MGEHPFDLLMELHSQYIRLDCAALHLARDVYADIDMGRHLRQLDALAAEVGAQRPGLTAVGRYRAMQNVLVDAHGFVGNQENYYDPQNTYFNRALDRRLGSPVTLAAVWIEVGRRLKWPVSGVALPGHFLVRFDDPEQFVLADAFAGGRSLSLGDCQILVEGRGEGCVSFWPDMLEPVDTRLVLTRMLYNLYHIYLAAGDWPRLAVVLRRLVAVEPHNGKHLQDLASVYVRRGDVRRACGCLHLYLSRTPDADDCHLVAGNLARLEAALTARN